MAESDSSESSPLLSPNAIMAVLTLVGGIVLVSHRLSSERPAKAAMEGTRPLGPQNIESRLWEDPFAAWDKLSEDEKRGRTSEGLTNLVDALSGDLGKTASQKTLVLGVMTSGQPYAEDKESRIRTRYAVGAALGSAGYAPETADHIGLVANSWPSSKELEQWKGNSNACFGLSGVLNAAGNCPGTNSNPCSANWTNLFRLRVPFEAYRKRQYFSTLEYGRNPGDKPSYDRVLLVWLDEEYFDDHPPYRLALFRGSVNQWLGQNLQSATDWVIIGPRSSSTLRDLLGAPGTPPCCPNLWAAVTEQLKAVRLILATPTAMDEVLVETNGVASGDFKNPRQAVEVALTNNGLFKSVQNFACTDKELAFQALDELKLRGIDPISNTNQHLVLVSEWDTFFSRMAGLAFAEAMSVPTNDTSACLAFIQQVREGTNKWPATLHRRFYLQGLDGEEVTADEAKNRDAQKEPTRQVPTSLEDIAKWQPDANKAEGSAQFDYLGRLGDELAELDRSLWTADGRSRVAAVGIMGSDVYDTLLILQALRDRLPDAVFFTTDLDARFWHPSELAWSRNLVVVSGYGLRLRDDLQAGVAPFRESAQCAVFLATLAAVDSSKVQGITQVPPLRFEIGRHGPVELKVGNRPGAAGGIWPHPLWRKTPRAPWLSLAVASGALVLAASLVWRAFRRLIWPCRDYCCETLRFSEEDFGGKEGVTAIFKYKEEHSKEAPLVGWMCRLELRHEKASPEEIDNDIWGPESRQRLKALITNCDRLVLMELAQAAQPAQGPEVEPNSNELQKVLQNACTSYQPLWVNLQKAMKGQKLSLSEVRNNRYIVSSILMSLATGNPPWSQAAAVAHRIALETHDRRRQRPLLFWLAVVLVGCALATGIRWAWNDTFGPVSGEPFNFQGTSAWPTEFMRFGTLALSVIVLVGTQRRLTQSLFDITRRYRLNPNPAGICGGAPWLLPHWAWLWPSDAAVTRAEVDANDLWSMYRALRDWPRRLARVALCVACYWLCVRSLSQLTVLPFKPVRGDVLLGLDPPLLIVSALAFLTLTFWMIDTAVCCAWFISRLSGAPTRYPTATFKHFNRLRALKSNDELVEPWIDLQLIADLTEPVGQFVYWPFIALLLMLVSRNQWFDHYTWHWPFTVVFGINIVLAAASYLILQRAAGSARQRATEHLQAMLNEKKRKAAESVVEHESEQAQRLLEDINNLRRGAFAPISKNPLVGAILANSSGLVLLQVLAQFYSK